METRNRDLMRTTETVTTTRHELAQLANISEGQLQHWCGDNVEPFECLRDIAMGAIGSGRMLRLPTERYDGITRSLSVMGMLWRQGVRDRRFLDHAGDVAAQLLPGTMLACYRALDGEVRVDLLDDWTADTLLAHARAIGVCGSYLIVR